MPYVEDENGKRIFIAKTAAAERFTNEVKERKERKDKDSRGYYKSKSRQDKQDARSDNKSDKRDYKIDKIDAKSQKSLATAAKRNSLANLIKWVLIAIGVLYGITKFGGFDIGGILEKIKGFTG
jgi:hypothetical protein